MASANPLRYAGYRYDEATGLYYLMARYYDANVGRFITRDTFHGFEDEPKSLNQYNYSHSNPVIYFDPSGHASILVRPNFKTGTDITTDFINYMKLNAEYARNMAKKIKLWGKIIMVQKLSSK